MSIKSSASKAEKPRYPPLFRHDLETDIAQSNLTSDGLSDRLYLSDVRNLVSRSSSAGSKTELDAPPEFCILTAIGEGTKRLPLSITEADFEALCMEWRIPPKLLKMGDTACNDFVVYCFGEPDTSIDDTSTAGAKNTQAVNASNQINILVRSLAAGPPIICFLCFDLNMPRAARCFFAAEERTLISSILKGINDNANDVLTNPVLIIGIFLAISVERVFEELRTHRGHSLTVASRLGVLSPQLRDFLIRQGYDGEPDNEYSSLNVDIYHLQYTLKEEAMTNSIIESVGNAILAMLETYTDKVHSPVIFDFIDMVSRRCENAKTRLDFWQRISQDQSTVLFNLINQRDSRLNYSVARSSRQIAAASKRDSSAMKTISILTLIFLPGTFVSAIFSTEVFDFNGSDVGYGKIAKAGWIYLLCSLMLTLLTVGIWAGWMVWRLNKAAEEEKKEMEELQRNEFEAQRNSIKTSPRRSNDWPVEVLSPVRSSSVQQRGSKESSRRGSYISNLAQEGPVYVDDEREIYSLPSGRHSTRSSLKSLHTITPPALPERVPPLPRESGGPRSRSRASRRSRQSSHVEFQIEGSNSVHRLSGSRTSLTGNGETLANDRNSAPASVKSEIGFEGGEKSVQVMEDSVGKD